MSSAEEEVVDAQIMDVTDKKPRDNDDDSEQSEITPRSPDFPSEGATQQENLQNQQTKGSIAIERNNDSARDHERDGGRRNNRGRDRHSANDCSRCSKCMAKTKQIMNLEEKLKAMQMKYNDFGMSCRPNNKGKPQAQHPEAHGNRSMDEWMNMIERRIQRNHSDHERKLNALSREVRGGGHGNGNGHRDDRHHRAEAQENDHQRGNRRRSRSRSRDRAARNRRDRRGDQGK